MSNLKSIDIIDHKIDPYSGIIISQESLGRDELKFGRDLQVSLQKWQKDGRKGVWITLTPSKSHFIPILIELGFEFYYCDPNSVVLTKWLPKTPNTIPHGPRHVIGVGGFVVNSKKEILVVKEKYGIVTTLWKLPGGAVEPGEDIEKAAVREVLEETGIQTEFISLLSFRTHHGVRLGLTDIFATCLLKPLNTNIVIQETEIADAKWMPLEEFMSLPHFSGTVYRRIMELGYKAVNGEYSGFIVEKLPGVFKSTNSLFHGLSRL